jgi:hypothetical protein
MKAIIVALVAACASCCALAQVENDQAQSSFGTSGALGVRIPGAQALPDLDPSPAAFSAHFGYATGGTALRNRGTGTISISGVQPPVAAAYLYWAVVTRGVPPSAATKLAIIRLFPGSAATATLTGTLIGIGPPPCWPGTDRINVFRAQVPTSLVTGNGQYEVKLLPGAGGSTAGGDPWALSAVTIPPLWEGASLVVIGQGNGTVAVYDVGLSGKTFTTTLSYSLNLPTAIANGFALWDNIGADGQIGGSRTAVAAGKITTINGVRIAGTGSAYVSTDWGGSSGLPIPQLWDDTGHDISAAVRASTRSLAVHVTSPNDCLTPVANVVQTR